jgi:hypothetical protein
MSKARVSITVDRKRAERKLAEAVKGFKDEGVLSLKEIGEAGKQFARSIAPYNSGKLFSNIIKRVSEQDMTATVVARNPINQYPGEYRAREGVSGKFNLVRWMHESNGIRNGKRHIKTGKPQFMYETRRYLAGIAPGKVTGRYRRVISRINNR